MNSVAQRDGEAPAVAEPAAPRIGETLSRARCAVGLSIEDVAQQLKFNVRQIEALEQDRYAELPGGIFARGMVRSYARLLKLDPQPLVERMAGEVPPAPAIDDAVSFRKPVPFSDTARRARLGYAVASLVVVMVAAALAFEWPAQPGTGTVLKFVPAARAPEAPPRAVEPLPVATRAAAGAPVGEPLAAVSPQAVAQLASPPALAAPATDEPAGRELTLTFAKASWVEVRDGEDRVLVSDLHAAGTSRVVKGVPPFRLVIGNAQHVGLRYGEQAVDLAPHTRRDIARFTLE